MYYVPGIEAKGKKEKNSLFSLTLSQGLAEFDSDALIDIGAGSKSDDFHYVAFDAVDDSGFCYPVTSQTGQLFLKLLRPIGIIGNGS